MEEIEGKLVGFTVGKSGNRKNGSEYTNYRYELEIDGKKKTMSGFIDPKELVGKFLIVSYEINQVGDKTYNNVKNIVEGVSKEELKEEDKKVNLVDVGEPTTQQPDYEERQSRIQDNITKGMTFNKTVDWIIATRKLALKGLLRDKDRKLIPAKDYPLSEHFDTVYDFLLKKATEKRKEKLK